MVITMNIVEAVNRYKELSIKNREKGGLIPTEANESYKLQKYIEENICDALLNGYKLVYDSNDDMEFI